MDRQSAEAVRRQVLYPAVYAAPTQGTVVEDQPGPCRTVDCREAAAAGGLERGRGGKSGRALGRRVRAAKPSDRSGRLQEGIGGEQEGESVLRNAEPRQHVCHLLAFE